MFYATRVVGPSSPPTGRYGEEPGCGCVSVKICLRPPLFGDPRLWWCHRHLRGTAGYERGEGNADSTPFVTGDPAGEQEPEGSPDALGSGRDAGVGRIKAEAVR